MLLVVEDVHWADRSTRDLLGFLARNLRTGIALVLTCRSEEVRRGHPLRGFLAGLVRSGAERIELGRLGRRELRGLLAGIAGEDPAPALLDEIWARSQGNALFAEELLAARTRGAELPDALLDLLLARVETLGARTRAMLDAAAVAPGRIGHELLARVVREGENLDEALREAVDRHVLAVDGEDGYVFRHALLREAIAGDLLPSRRRGLHAEWARVLAATDGADPGLLAHHWHAAGDLEQSLRASVRAGRAAEEASAVHEARHHYLRAVELWPKAPQAAADSPLTRPELLRRAAHALAITGSPGEAIAVAGRVGAAAEQSHALATLGTALAGLGDLAAGEARLRQAHALAQDARRAAGPCTTCRTCWCGTAAAPRRSTRRWSARRRPRGPASCGRWG